MGDLAAFILARIEEDEVAAEECAKIFPSPWEIADRGWRVRIYSANVPLSKDVGDPGDERTPCVIEVEPTYAHDGWLSDNVEHIARHDPARVLAQCAALRAVVERCSGPASDSREEDHALADNVLCALASIWAEHESFDPEWRLG